MGFVHRRRNDEHDIGEYKQQIEDFRSNFRETLAGSDKYTYCGVTDMIELRAVSGILYLRSVKNLNISSCRDVFYHESALDIFSCVMSYNRFSFLLC